MPTLPEGLSAAGVEVVSTTKQLNAELQMATEQYHNWKQTLSGALNDRQLVSGLGILFAFYVFYSVFNTITGDKDEDNITCQCPLNHRAYYQTIVYLSISIWIAIFAGIVIYDIYTLYKTPRLSGFSPPSGNEDKDNSKSIRSNKTPSGPEEKSTYTKLDEKLKHYENQFWLEFYKAYSVGAGAYESMKLPNIESILKKEEEITCNKSETNDDENNTKSNATKNEHDDDDEIDGGIEEIAKQSFFFFYPFLVIVRLFAQLSLVPVLILQMLNTYAWVCFTEDFYCEDAISRYQLGLAQTYMTFGFYIALLIAILSTIMLRWFPYSKHARDIKTTSFA